MSYTRHALGLLNAQYRSVLKKCLLINLGLFTLSAPALATDVTVTTVDGLNTSANYTSDSTMTLGNNITVSSEISGGANDISAFTLDGNGHIISSDSTNKQKAYFAFYGGENIVFKNLTLKDLTKGNSGIINFSRNNSNVISTASLENVTFDGLTNTSDTFGDVQWGTIDVQGGSTITSISGSKFQNITITVTDPSEHTDGAAGGAIYVQGSNNGTGSYSKINKIENSTFANNSITTEKISAFGGAILTEGQIEKISGTTFNNNTVSVSGTSSISSENSASNSAYGGAISIGSPKSDREVPNVGIIENSAFENNSVKSESGEAFGGALWIKSGATVDGKIMNTSFKKNSATSTSSSALGGAIYTSSDLYLQADGAGNKTEFTDNYVQTGSGDSAKKTENAIYVASNEATLTFNASNGGKVIVNDEIDGTEGYKIDILGDDVGGRADLNASVHKANVTLTSGILGVGADTLAEATLIGNAGGVLDQADGDTENIQIHSLTGGTIAENKTPAQIENGVTFNGKSYNAYSGIDSEDYTGAKYNIDLKFEADEQNKFKSVSSDTFTITSASSGYIYLSNIQTSDILQNTEFIVQIIKATDKTNFPQLTFDKDKVLNTAQAVMESDDILAEGFATVTTNTANDSLYIKYLDDPLAAWAELPVDANTEKTFTWVNNALNTSLSRDITALNGTSLSLIGLENADASLDLQGHKLLNTIGEDQTVTISDLTITNTVSGSNTPTPATVGNNGTLNLTEVALSGDISGTGATNVGKTDSEGNAEETTVSVNSLTQNTLSVAENATLNSTGAVAAAITNSGTITASEVTATAGASTNSGSITANSLTVAENAKVDNSHGTIIAPAVTINADGSLTTNAESLKNSEDGKTVTITNNGTLNLTDGTNNNTIGGENGTTEISGEVTNATNITQGNVTIDTDAKLTNGDNGKITVTGAVTNNGTLTTLADAVNGSITNNNTLNLTGGTNSNAISGSGTTTIIGEVINSAAINQAVVIAAGDDEGKNKGTLTSSADNLGGTIENNGILNLSDTLDKAVSGSGTTIAGENFAFAVNTEKETQASVEGTLNLNGKTLDLQGSGNTAAYTTYEVGSLQGNGTDESGTANLKIDVDMSTDTPQSGGLNITSGTNNKGTINLASVNVRKDGEKTGNDIVTYISAAANATLNNLTTTVGGNENKIEVTNNTSTATEAYTYTFTAGTTGKLNVTTVKTDNKLKDFIQGTLKKNAQTYSLTGDYKLSDENPLGTTANTDASYKNTLYLNLNGHSITAENTGDEGMKVAEGYTFNIDGDNGKMTGFGTAITVNENGTLNVKDTTFTGNTTDIANNGTLNLTGTNTADTITGTGAAVISGGTTTVNKELTQGTLNVNDGATLNNSGTVAATLENAGTISGGTVKTSGKSQNTGAITAALDNSGTLTNDGTITGAVTNSGTLTTAADKITGDITNSGGIYLTGGTNTNTITGTGSVNLIGVTNNGSITAGTANGTDIAVLSEKSTNNGSITVANELAVAEKADFTNNGTITAKKISIESKSSMTTNADAVISNSKDSAVSIANDGTLNLTGGTNSNAITGGGTTNINGEVTTAANIANTVSISSDGKLTVDGADTLGDLNNSGTLDIGNQKVTVGDAVFNDGSVLALKINSLTDNGTLTANSFTISDKATLKATVGQNVLGGQKTGEVTLLALAGADPTDFSNKFADEFSNNMYTFTKKAGEDGVYEITQDKTAGEIVEENGGNKTEGGAADAWVDGGGFEDGSNAGDIADGLADLAQNDGEKLKETLAKLMPSQVPFVKTVTLDHTNRLYHSLQSHLRGELDYKSAMEGLSSGDVSKGASVWFKAYMSKGEQDEIKGIEGFDLKNKGVIIAADKKFDNNVKAGIGYNYDDAETSDGRDADITTHSVFAYGEYKPNAWFVNGLLGYNWAEYEEKKNILGYNANAEYDVEYANAQLTTGYEFKGAVDVTPEASLRYTHVERDGYTDNAGQNVADDDFNVLTASTGVRVAKSFVAPGCLVVRPEAYLGVSYDVISEDEHSSVRLANGSFYNVTAEELNRFAVEAGLGISAEITYNLEANLNYLGNYRKNFTSHAGTAGLKYKF